MVFNIKQASHLCKIQDALIKQLYQVPIAKILIPMNKYRPFVIFFQSVDKGSCAALEPNIGCLLLEYQNLWVFWYSEQFQNQPVGISILLS